VLHHSKNIPDYDNECAGQCPALTSFQLLNNFKMLPRSIWIKEDFIMRTLTANEINAMYRKFEYKYNKIPVEMSRCDAFSSALRDGLISQDEFNYIRTFYGNLWNYTSD
jgi:hypothetical protein